MKKFKNSLVVAAVIASLFVTLALASSNAGTARSKGKTQPRVTVANTTDNPVAVTGRVFSKVGYEANTQL